MAASLPNIFASSKEFLSIEIGDDYFKAAHVKTAGGHKEIVNSTASTTANLSEDDIVGMIRDFARAARIKKPTVINVIPSHYAISKNIEIPSTDKKEIKEIIYLQAGRHTPYSSTEIIMDYTEIGTMHNRYTKILLVIVKRDVVTKRYDLIKKAGFRSDSAVLASEPVSRLCYENRPDKAKEETVGVVHLDKYHVDFTVVNKGKVIYLRPIPIGITYDANKAGELKQLLFAELKKSLDSYQAENIEAMPARVYFIGVTELISGLEQEIEKEIGVSIEVLPYHKVLAVPKELPIDKVENKQMSLLTTIAPLMLAHSANLNLVPDDVKVKQELKKRAIDVMVIGISGMLILIIFCATLITNMFFKEFYLGKLKSSYTKENQEAQNLKAISDRTLLVKRFAKQKGDSLYILTEFFAAIPNEVYINSINFKTDNTLVFTGTADSMSRVFSLVKQLEDNKLFKGVKVDFTKTRRTKEQEVADFGLTMSIEEDILNAKSN